MGGRRAYLVRQRGRPGVRSQNHKTDSTAAGKQLGAREGTPELETATLKASPPKSEQAVKGRG